MDDKFHLMISYSHNSKQITLKVFDWFEEHGLKTWIDKSNALTVLTENIVNGISNSEVFIPCLSSSYEQSIWCKRELEYAVRLNKKIVPIIVEDSYQMNKDIDFLIGGIKYFELCKGFDSTMNEVLKAVKEYIGSSQPIKKGDTNAVQAEQHVTEDNFSQRENSIKKPCCQDENYDEGFDDTNCCDCMVTKPFEDRVLGKFSQLSINIDPKVTQNLDSSANKSFFELPQKNPAADLSVEDKKRYQDKLKLPLKDFRNGFGDLRKSLDVGDKVIKIVDYLKLGDKNRKSILFTDHGGGNHALSFLELLKMHKPDLTIALFRKHLLHHSFIEAEKFITKYNDEKVFTDVSHKDTRELSFKLSFCSDSIKTSWRDLASDLGISFVDISRIDNSGRHPAKFSRTEKLFEVLLTCFPQCTIGDFLNVLEKLKLNDDVLLMKEKIIASM